MGASNCGWGASRLGLRRPCGAHDLVLMGFQWRCPWLISRVPAGRSIAEPSKCGIGEGLGSGGLGVMGLFRGKQDIFGCVRITAGTRTDEEAELSAGRRPVRAGNPASPFAGGCGGLRTVAIP